MDTAFGEQVRRARMTQGLDQSMLASLAGVNKETVMRIEQGFDTKVTTIRKLRSVLPSLDSATRIEDVDAMPTELSELAARIGHLVQGFISEDRLHKVRAYVLQQLTEEQAELISPALLQEMNRKQLAAERRLVDRGTATGKSRKRRSGNGH